MSSIRRELTSIRDNIGGMCRFFCLCILVDMPLMLDAELRLQSGRQAYTKTCGRADKRTPMSSSKGCWTGYPGSRAAHPRLRRFFRAQPGQSQSAMLASIIRRPRKRRFAAWTSACRPIPVSQRPSERRTEHRPESLTITAARSQLQNRCRQIDTFEQSAALTMRLTFVVPGAEIDGARPQNA